ncbi:MAG TPA: YbaK/EbsC family protein [Solirubrobacteraceae bacterium]|jgi:Ala-tRNA(Pro) deacylase|nr:YbaK/EbsC family protein [Solirubrobacteraceae bacterium]
MSETAAPHGIDAVAAFLDAQQVSYEVVDHRPTFSAAAEARASGAEPREAAKTLALHDRGGYRMAVIPASHRLDLGRVRELLGATSHLRLATEAELERDFPMFDVGAMPPLAPMVPMPEILDVHLLYHERILCAGGDHGHALRLDPRDLLRVCEPRVAAICETPAGAGRFRDVPRV